MGEMLDGGMAEYCRVGADQLIKMPPDVSFADAAALPVAYGMAHRMLVTHGTVKAGDRVLILGASGGVGTGCVMLAKHLGAEVIACAGSADKMDRLKALGADHVVNYRETDFSKWAIQTYGKPQRRSYEGGVDVVINFTGGDTRNLGALFDRQGEPESSAIIGAALDGSETIMSYRALDAMVGHVVADCGAKLVICDASRRVLLSAAPPYVRIVSFDATGEDGLDAWLDPGRFDPIVPRDDEAALCLYTSGSTGRPKGVMLSHGAHRWVVETRMKEADLRGERLLIAAPLYHMNALALTLLVCASGATAVLMPQFEAIRYIDAISRYCCTWLTAVPPMIAMMMREKAALRDADLSSVRTVRMGSAPVNDALAAQTRALMPNARIINAYGTTEGGPIVFTDHGAGLNVPTGSLGIPHPDVAVRLVEPDAPERGVLQMRSPAIMLGYHDRPDVASPITSDGYYDTGDVFRCDGQGFYFFLGRSDDMFVCGGENIFPGEVEAVPETHPDILQACVVPVEDEIKGAKPVAFVVQRPGGMLDEDGVKQYALANAPAYQHPRRVWFLDTMLLASTNKIDRASLRLRAEAEVAAR